MTFAEMIAEINDAIENGCDNEFLEEVMDFIVRQDRVINDLKTSNTIAVNKIAKVEDKLQIVLRHYTEAIES